MAQCQHTQWVAHHLTARGNRSMWDGQSTMAPTCPGRWSLGVSEAGNASYGFVHTSGQVKVQCSCHLCSAYKFALALA